MAERHDTGLLQVGKSLQVIGGGFPVQMQRGRARLIERRTLPPSCAKPAKICSTRVRGSGILNAGVIGGKNQTGNFKIDARFAKDELIRRIQVIAEHRENIDLYNLDAVALLQTVVPQLPDKTLVYLDPPYYVKGGGGLYEHHYQHEDHVRVAQAATAIRQHCQFVNYSLSYCAQNRAVFAAMGQPQQEISV